LSAVPLKKRIKENFSTPVILTRDQTYRLGEIRRLGKELCNHIDGCLENSREKSLALTRIEEAILWVGAGLERGMELKQEAKENK
jgi:hypothetical protein